MTDETFLLTLLVFAIVATRPTEERRWRAGRLTDRMAAMLVVGRLPVLALGFVLITSPPLEVTVALALVSFGIAALLFPLLVRRLRRGRRADPGSAGEL